MPFVLAFICFLFSWSTLAKPLLCLDIFKLSKLKPVFSDSVDLLGINKYESLYRNRHAVLRSHIYNSQHIFRIKSLILNKDMDAHKLIRWLSLDPELRELFEGPNSDGNTIRGHTLDVFQMFKKQMKYYKSDLNPQYYKKNVNKLHILRFVIALHDIGKPLAIYEGDSNLQHEKTTPIVLEVMSDLRFSKKEIQLAQAIIENDALGLLLQHQVSIEFAFREMQRVAQEVDMSLIEYFNLRTFFYVIDAGSYAVLREQVFVKNDQGKLIPKSPLYYHLKRMIWGAVDKSP